MKKENLQNLLFLDVEATGLEEEDRLVQVAYAYNGQESEQMFHPEVEMSVRAMEVTHITNKHLAHKDAFAGSDYYGDLETILDQDETIFVAHNAPYDVNMLEREGLKVGKVIDTYKIAHAFDVRSEIPAYRLQFLRYFFGLEVEDVVAHDALGDVRVLMAVFEKLYDEMISSGTHEELIQKMIHISSEPILIKMFNFGKYRDELVADVARRDRGYLEWLLRQKEAAAAEGDVDENWIYTLKKYVR